MTPHLVAGCFTSEGSYAGEWMIACPACGADYSHVREAGTLRGRDEYEARVYLGTHVLGVTSAQRSALVVVIDGECGHSWELRIQQHKGVNLVEVRRVAAPASLDECEAL
jgi:adenine-specific DNA methylase